jgi:hypothetical protein
MDGAIPPLLHMTSWRAQWQLYFTRVYVRYLAKYVSHREMFRTKVIENDIHTMAGGAQFHKIQEPLQNPRCRRMTWSKLHTKDLEKIVASIQNIVARAMWLPGFVRPSGSASNTTVLCIYCCSWGNWTVWCATAKLEKCWLILFTVHAQSSWTNKTNTPISSKGNLRTQQCGGTHGSGRPTTWTRK